MEGQAGGAGRQAQQHVSASNRCQEQPHAGSEQAGERAEVRARSKLQAAHYSTHASPRRGPPTCPAAALSCTAQVRRGSPQIAAAAGLPGQPPAWPWEAEGAGQGGNDTRVSQGQAPRLIICTAAGATELTMWQTPHRQLPKPTKVGLRAAPTAALTSMHPTPPHHSLSTRAPPPRPASPWAPR